MSVTITRVPIEEELQKLVTEDVYSITVDPQHTSNLLKFTGSKLPKLENIEHVKRVKRDAASGKLSVIMCQCRKIEHTGLLDIIKDTEWQNHEITRQAVPVTAPYTREQYEEWKAVWPVAFRPPVKLREEITDDDREYVRQSLSTINELLGTQGSDDRKVAVAIGDPKQCKLVAQATDQTRQLRHPLKHAVMCCVGLVAEAEVAKRSKALDDTAAIGILAAGCVVAVTDKEYQAISETLLKEMSNHHDFTTEGLFHDLAQALGLYEVYGDLYPGSPTAKKGYKAIYKKLCALSKDTSTATPQQIKVITDLENFVKNVLIDGS
ncbi:tRNA-specific adenosine deaminase subunit tad3 [Coemansia sp. Benny D115]|nr:tRNA-specific adenosine deaminase subunit tad3 [Coemansia sp. Benny D115]